MNDDDLLSKPIQTLIGHPVRVYHTGDAITEDYIADRVNIELSGDGVIVRVWMG
jgi:hypothetical protein